MIYKEVEITPEFIYFCNNSNEKKCIYQRISKEIKVNFNSKEIVQNVHIQNTINFNDSIENYTYAIIKMEDDEYIINDKFLLESMFNDMKNTFDRKYNIMYIFNSPVKVTSEYKKDDTVKKNTIFDKRKFGFLGGFLLLTGGIIYKMKQ